MPELPEVETVRTGLERRFREPRLESVLVRDSRLRWPVVAQELEQLIGARFVGFRRRAKYLVLDASNGYSLVLHLGMSGQVVVTDADVDYDSHDHVILGVRDGMGEAQVRLRDPRRFGLAVVSVTSELPTHPLFAHLGPEPLGPDFDAAHLVRSSCNRRAPIKNVVMDARVVVGVGNIYASEALWRAEIHPARAAGRIAASRLGRLRGAVRDVLRDAIECGGTTLRDFRDTQGNLGYFAIELAAYGREGAGCLRCGKAIRRIVQAGRSTYYCPGCQR